MRKDKMTILTLHGDSCTLQTFAGFLPPDLHNVWVSTEWKSLLQQLSSALLWSLQMQAVRTVKGGNHQ